MYDKRYGFGHLKLMSTRVPKDRTFRRYVYAQCFRNPIYKQRDSHTFLAFKYTTSLKTWVYKSFPMKMGILMEFSTLIGSHPCPAGFCDGGFLGVEL